MPKISIIVPIYKTEKYLNRCIDSILNQTFTNFELILIDDGSPDNCGTICDAYAKKDERIKVIHKENGGLSDARNSGIKWAFENSDSEWIAFIDSDDWIHSRYLEILYSAAIKHTAEICICDYERKNEFDGSHTEIINDSVHTYVSENNEEYLCDNMQAILANAKIYKKELFCGIRYPVGKIYEDEFVTYKLILSCKKIAVVDETLYYYFQNPEGIMNTAWSEKNLSIIEAREQQIEFSRANGFGKAYKLFVKVYIFCLTDIITKKLQYLSMDKRNFYEKALRKKLRIALKKYRGDYDYSIYKWAFLVAHPVVEKVLDKMTLNK